MSDTQNDVKFWGVKIWDDDGSYYYTEINVDLPVQHNRPTSSQVVYNSKNPYHIHNGKGFYYSGSASATFAPIEDCEYNFYDGNTEYILAFLEWLHNDKIKYLQISEKTIIPVGILETVKAAPDNNHTLDDGYKVTVSFDWEQLAPAIISE